MTVPHDGWARHYDQVLERTFGRAYRDFTERTLREVRERVVPPARIIDFGAGTGRLAVPLASEGYRVTAVDPSGAMLERLRLKESGAPSAIECVVSGVEDYSGHIEHDFALCVFTVLGYLLDERALSRAARSMAAALRPGGLLLIDIPGRVVFEGFDIETDDVIRCVEIDAAEGGGDLFWYRERTAIQVDGVQEAYEDTFVVRYWPREAVLEVLDAAGFDLEEDVSEGFAQWDADYLLLRRR
ncbi:MAG: class I SAM-dependent methyltransferase [Gemmatimonadota bacterium]